MTKTEQQISELLVNAGEAKSFAFEALFKAKQNDYEEAAKLIKQSGEAFLKGHKYHMELIKKEAGGEKIESSILMMHAEDYLMTSLLAKELIEEMIDLRKEIAMLKSKEEL